MKRKMGTAGTFATEYTENTYLDPAYIEPARRAISRLARDEEEEMMVLEMLGI